MNCVQDGNNGVESAANIVKGNKMKYCMHKNDIVVGVRNGWKKDEIITILNKAYPHVLTTYSGLTVAAQYFLLRLYNNAKNMKDVYNIVHNEELCHRMDVSSETSKLRDTEQLQIDTMPQFYFKGVALGIAYAHPDSGDTVATVMIGGLRTVLNGHFTVNTGQLVQWYFEFEASAFDSNGERLVQDQDLPLCIEDGLEMLRSQQENVLSNLSLSTLDRKTWHERESGNFPGYSGKDCVIYLKPYVRNSKGGENILDRERVCGIFIASARPFEQVDIKLQRQSV